MKLATESTSQKGVTLKNCACYNGRQILSPCWAPCTLYELSTPCPDSVLEMWTLRMTRRDTLLRAVINWWSLDPKPPLSDLKASVVSPELCRQYLPMRVPFLPLEQWLGMWAERDRTRAPGERQIQTPQVSLCSEHSAHINSLNLYDT